MTLPNFLIIGAAKSGTDSLYEMLGRHPQIFISPNKEPMFFVAEGRAEVPYRGPGDREVLVRWDSWVSSIEHYESLFAGVKSERAVGEASTWYLYDEGAPRRIKTHVPGAKMIAILRNPVDRAYSAFTMLLRDGRETTANFMKALAAEDKRIRAGWEPIWHYRKMGLYHSQLRRYLDIFPRSQLRVVLHEDFVLKPRETVREVFRFLDVDDGFEAEASARLNVSLVPAHTTYHRLVTGQSTLKVAGRAVLPVGVRRRIREHLPVSAMLKPSPMPAEARAFLIDAFRDDVLALEHLLDRDLGRWLR